jgi:hypothetical protein
MADRHHRAERITLNRPAGIDAERRSTARAEHPATRSLDPLTVLEVVVALLRRLRPALQIRRVRAAAAGRNLRDRQHDNRARQKPRSRSRVTSRPGRACRQSAGYGLTRPLTLPDSST